MSGRTYRRIATTWRARLVLVLAALMVTSLLQTTSSPPSAAQDTGGSDEAESGQPVPGSDGLDVLPRTVEDGPRVPQEAPRADWPDPGTATVELTAGARVREAQPAGDLPVRIAPAASGSPQLAAQVRVLDREATEAAGVNGVLLSIEPQPGSRTGTLEVSLDYVEFAGAFGGGFGSRLTFRQLPACALETPDDPECRASVPLPSENDAEEQTLTAPGVELGASETLLLAAVADDESMESDYTATELTASSTWDVGLNTGDFAWSYEMPMPDVPGSLLPSVGLSYSSGSIDGQTGGTNNQASWVGDGFELWPGYIERRYQSCAEEGVENEDGGEVGDLCWEYDNAFISFNGQAGELVPAGDDEWKFQRDDGTRIRRLTSSARANGDNDNEYWELTSPEGTRYYFGYHRLPGWEPGDEATDSTWTTPVYGNDSGEPCHASSVVASSCVQAWRWNLDYVVDVRGNAVAYYYDAETNSYGRFLDETDNARYTRGGTLDRIEYGLRDDTVYSAQALARVDFSGTSRCLPQNGVDCAASAIDDNELYWYDTPWDLNCDADEDCDAGRFSPTFWTRHRLTGVTSQVLTASGYHDVDSWAFDHRWGSADVDYQLLLDGIQRTGRSASPAVTLPKTTFAYTQRANRLDEVGDGYAPFVKERLSSVADEHGGQLDVEYSGEACDASALPTPETNTTRCFPQYLGGGVDIEPDLEWFNKYVVDAVIATDRTGGSPEQVTRYSYLGDAAWHFDDDNGLVPDDEKTWSQWRGYSHVRVMTGGEGSDAVISQEDTWFLRGMHGDRRDESGGTKSVSVALPSGEGEAITDHRATEGFAYRTARYDGVDGRILEKTVNRPWHHETASDERDWGTVTSDLTGTARTTTWVSLDDGAGEEWRTTRTDNTFDTVAGRLTETNDLADISTDADDRCTRTTYLTNAEANLLGLSSRAETVSVNCDATPDRSTDVISDERYAYDGRAHGAVPTEGNRTATAVLKDHNGTTATYLESGATFDRYGRPLTATDLTANLTATGGTVTRQARTDGRTTTTAFTPTSGFPTTSTVTTPRARPDVASSTQVTTTTFDPLRGQPTRVADTNNRSTVTGYDALGRVTAIWLPDRAPLDDPTYRFAYRIEEGEPVSVATYAPDTSGYLVSYALLDGFLRDRQTQAPGPDGGRLLTDTFHDERGLVTRAFATYYAEEAPTQSIFLPENALSVETQTRYTHDTLGRETRAQQLEGNTDGATVLATTQTSHHGDRTTVVPPQGATTTTTLTDARGQTTELRQHHGRSPSTGYDTTRYAYTPAGQLEEVTDPAGNSWTFTYDQLGRRISGTDPDAGTSESTYDDRGQLVTTTNARGITLANVYDGLGRRTQLREDSVTGPLRAEWVYDTLSRAEGQLARSVRHHNGAAYTNEVTQYDALYRAIRGRVTIPEEEGALAGTYESSTNYLDFTGLVGSQSYDAVGGLSGEGPTYRYDDTHRLIKTFGLDYDADVSYDFVGKPQLFTLSQGADTPFTEVRAIWERGTQRLSETGVQRENQPGFDRAETYRYDESGNILSIADTARTGTDVQCFQYDHLRRLTEAWAQGTGACAGTPSAGAMGGPAPYWHSYTYDLVGNRLTETLHEQDTERAYSYPEPGTPQPHTVSSVTQDAPGVRSLEEFTYDEGGNTRTRQVGGETEELTWDAEGHLANVEKADGATTEYLYDADGQRLIGRTPTETTLYLGGHTEVVLPEGEDAVTATRYIDLGGGHTAVIADDGTVSYAVADHHGTGQLSIDAATLEPTQRRTLPFGDLRGEVPSAWPGTRGFVGGTMDPSTGLTHLGAREYDPALGRFISLDPLMDPANPQQFHGYTYASSNPLAFADPTGLIQDGCWIYGCDFDGKGKPTGRKPSGGGGGGGGGSGGGGGGSSCDLRCQQGQQAAAEYRCGGPCAATPPNDCDAACRATAEYRCGWDCYGPQRIPEAPPGWLVFGLSFIPFIDLPTCIAEGDGGACLDSVTDIAFEAKLAFGLAKTGLEAGIAALLRRSDSCNSFTYGTSVLLADGTALPIEDVEIGDVVMATDPETGETSPRTVTAEITGTGIKNVVTLAVATTEGTSTTITATDGHPFWSPSQSAWLEAADLTPGTTLLTKDGTQTTVTATTHTTTATTVHNLTVEGIHTYYVLAGATPVLVHNSSRCGWATRTETAGDVVQKYTPGQSTRDPASQWFHEELSDQELLDSINNAAEGDGIAVSRGGTILGGHHRWDELQRRIQDGRIDPDTPIRIDILGED
ncbi:polymorphic toxin-type HINT domain-containing protein [Streptomyces sp. PT12]|uniref:polymorphic toxin-type HINT domain-containing protein n=1 Tax=Streptomyces sp. PT12 TaxID=1510197 RepID=UPI000DE2A30D|nr:polymorphic toxin-type HINT domain-containing protein [Streptomyces sp. PT12]RBM04651.1 sugar-binding protein [Streptomyces sp. PT12]